jgi:hypothetical protein
MKLTQINLIIDIPELNQFKIGDEVLVKASEHTVLLEGTVIGIEMQRLNASDVAVPGITLLHDGGRITRGFKPGELRLISRLNTDDD